MVSPGRVLEAVEGLRGEGVEEVLVSMDLGSSVLGAEALLEREPGLKDEVRLVDAPAVPT